MTDSNVAPADTKAMDKADAKSRGLRTLVQAVVGSVLTCLGALGAEVTVPGFEMSYEALGVGMGIAVLTPVLAYLQRRAGK